MKIRMILILTALAALVLLASCDLSLLPLPADAPAETGNVTEAPADTQAPAETETPGESPSETGHEHQWQEASCVAPKTCSVCGETEGKALGHKGKLGEICQRCGEMITLNILLPEFPAEAWLNDDNKTRVDSVTYAFDGNEIVFTAKATKIEEKKANIYSGFLYRILDVDGRLLKASPITVANAPLGEEKVFVWRFYVQDLDLDPSVTEVYFEIKDYHGN